MKNQRQNLIMQMKISALRRNFVKRLKGMVLKSLRQQFQGI